MKKHYIAGAGLHGCLYQTCEVHETYKEAVDSLAFLHELGEKRRRKLSTQGYLELNLHRDGNEYCEIIECGCGHPDVHKD
jgi:hypothetical protein